MPPAHHADVLIFSDRSDTHADLVLRRLDPDLRPLMLNLDGYGRDFELSWAERSGLSCWLSGPGLAVSLERVRSVWWRRPLGQETQVRWASRNGRMHPTLSFVIGALGNLSSHAFFLNHPHVQMEADRKVRQLHVARSVGLQVPETLVTGNLKEAKAFVAEIGLAIVKAHGSIAATSGTRMFDEDVFRDAAELGPVIVQRYVAAEREHRVVHVCGMVAGGTFDLTGLGLCPDVREVKGLMPERADLPAPVTSYLAAYCRRLGLRYAAFDLREAAGVHYFLEANTAGEWLYVDACNDWRITAAVAQVLSRPPRASRPTADLAR